MMTLKKGDVVRIKPGNHYVGLTGETGTIKTVKGEKLNESVVRVTIHKTSPRNPGDSLCFNQNNLEKLDKKEAAAHKI